MMNEHLSEILKDDYDHWVNSPDDSRIVAWKDGGGHADVFDSSNGEKVVTIKAEMDYWFWAPGGKELISHDYRITNIWDATTGKYLRSIEATYDRPSE